MQALAGQPGQGGATIGNMSEADAVPLPREGEVFFDVRGEARSMRLSWYADSKVAVFSIWQGNRCTGTFRLPFVDLTRMIQTLQAGPNSPAQPQVTQASSYQGHANPDSGYGQTSDYGHPDYGPSDYAHADQGQPAYGHARGGAYGPSGDSGMDQAYRGYGGEQAASTERGYGGEYQDDYGRDRGYGAGPEPSYGGQPYGSSPAYGSGEPQRAGEPHGEPYNQGHHYDSGPQYDPDQPYPRRYDSAESYGSADPYGPVQPYGPAQPYSPGQQYGASPQSSYGLPDYQPPNYGDPRSGRDSDRPARSDRQQDAESVPDTAMMSYPAVPARNAPSSYR